MIKTKRRKIFICIFAVSLLINVIPLLIFKDKAAISIYSLFAVFVILVVSCIGISVYSQRYEGNYLYYPRPKYVPPKDDDHVFTEEYQNEFFWQFCVYWFAIPFYIPCVFFVSEPWGSILWPMCVFFAPYLVYFIYHISKMIRSEKKYQIRKQRHEQELKEQMLREELGRFK